VLVLPQELEPARVPVRQRLVRELARVPVPQQRQWLVQSRGP